MRHVQPFLGGSFEWLKDDGVGGRYLDARTLFFYVGTVNTPAMAVEMIGKGWPAVLSSLKSFLESGKGMMAPWYQQAGA